MVIKYEWWGTKQGINESSHNILGQPENDSNIQNITSPSGAEADPNIQNQDEKLGEILDQLESDRGLLYRCTECIRLLLEAGADPNLKNQDGKTLLHYVAERNDTKGIKILLKKGASLKIRDHSGKTPFEYVTEHECRQAIKDLGYDLDDSHENEGNSTTPDGSVDDCSNSSGDDSQIESVKLSDCNTESDYIRNPAEKCKEIKDKLESIAYEGIVGRDRQAQNGKLEEVKIDNQCFHMKYSQDSIIEPAKIFNKTEALKDKALNLKVGILQIGESIVRVESIDGKRNYTDILKGSIEMSFTTEVGEISICLQKDGNKIKVEIDEENKAKFNKLKDKSSLGENCLLEGENVSEVIGKNFESVPTETTKDVPSTDLTQVCLQQNREVALVSYSTSHNNPTR